MEKFLGFDIGGTKCAVVLGDSEGNVLKKIRFDTTSFEETLASLLKAGEELFCDEVMALGVSCGGPLSSKKGIIMSPPNLPNWDNVEIVRILEEKFSRRAFLKNDADAGAIAEWKWGAAKGYDNVVFLTFSTGMGAGLIINGKPYSGACDMAGEVGHIRLYEGGHIGYNKEGSFEGYCSGGGIAQYNKGSAKEIAERAKNGNCEAINLYKKIARDLGKGIAVIVDILNPEVIVLGTIYVHCKELIEEEMLKALREEALSISCDAVKIVPAQLAECIGDKAALSVALCGYDELKEVK